MGFHDFKVPNIAGQDFALREYKGKVVLVVNTASKCGYTKQYKGLQELQDEYGSRGFTVLGFPSNDFGKQEPGTNAEIEQFCELNYKTTFPLFSKAPVSGSEIQPLFSWLTEKGGPVQWNFEKFLIGRDGKILHRFASKVEPTSKEVLSAIEAAL